jgi:hypothetical protein
MGVEGGDNDQAVFAIRSRLRNPGCGEKNEEGEQE